VQQSLGTSALFPSYVFVTTIYGLHYSMDIQWPSNGLPNEACMGWQ
jgi:hypothetical protein